MKAWALLRDGKFFNAHRTKAIAYINFIGLRHNSKHKWTLVRCAVIFAEGRQ